MQGWDVFIYINKLLLELLEHGKPLKVIAYTDMQSLYKNVHIMKNILEKRLLIDITTVREIAERNEINIIWNEKEKQLGDILIVKILSWIL